MKLPRVIPGQSVATLSRSPLLQELRPIEFIVYLRLVGLSDPHRKIYPLNSDLHQDPRSTVKALRVLEEKGLIKIGKVSQAISRAGREIEVLR